MPDNLEAREIDKPQALDICHELSGRLFNVPWLLTAEKQDKLVRIIREASRLAVPMQKAVTDLSSPERYRQYTGDGVGVIPVEGVLMHTGTGYGWLDAYLGITTYGRLDAWFEQGMNDDALDTIVFRHRSPGGEVNGLFDLVDKIFAGRSKKRLIAAADDESYSAAYAIYSAASERYLSRTSGVGSIGVRAVHVSQAGWDANIGLEYQVFFEGKRKNDFDPHAPLTDEAKGILREHLKSTMGMFVAAAARNLGISEEKVRSTEAGIYSGENAVSAGLADAVMAYADVLKSVQSKSSGKKGAGNMAVNESASGSAVPQPSEADMNKLRREGLEEGRKAEQARQQSIREKVSLMGFCLSAEAQEKLTTKLIDENVSVEAAAALIMQAAADQAKQSTIVSTTTPLGGGAQGDPWNNALLAECRARAEQAKAQGGKI